MDTELLKQLTDRLGSNTEYLFQLAIRQNYYYVAVDFIFIIVLMIGLLLMFKYWKNNFDDLQLARIIILVITGFIIFIILICAGYRLVNPQFAAFNDIMNSLSK